MADINIGSDQLLTTTLNDNDRVTITKADTGQQVATMKVADFKATIGGRDYSVLTEREVPGEYFLDVSGAKKQIYTRTYVFDSSFAKYLYGTYAAAFIMGGGIEAVIDCVGYTYMIQDEYTQPLLPVLQNITSSNTSLYMVDFSVNSVNGGRLVCNILSVGVDKDNVIGKSIKGFVAVKYIKK